MTEPRPLKVFLCHASADKPTMYMPRLQFVSLLTLSVLFILTACTSRVASDDSEIGIITSVVVATDTPPTPTQFPILKPLHPKICDDSAEVGGADSQKPIVVSPGQHFIKTWVIMNTGICDWEVDNQLIFAFGDLMGGKSIYIGKRVKPDEVIEISVKLTAPNIVGEYVSAWRLKSSLGATYGAFFKIIVKVE